jgi:type I restriction enzyme, S subunit
MTVGFKNEPKLRFPGFEEDWINFLLSENADFSKGRGISKDQVIEEGIPCILYGELYTKYGHEIKNVYSHTDKLNAQVLSDGNEIIVPASGETPIDIARASAVTKIGIALGGDLNIVKPNGKFHNRFLSLQINGRYKIKLSKYAQGKSIVHISNESIGKLNISAPSIDEQLKISEFFSKLDQRIEAKEKKLGLLQEQKKGYVQKIFSQELRFKGENGNDYPDWKTTMLDKICTIKTGNMNVQDSVSDGKYTFFDRSETIKKLNEYSYDEEALIYPGEGKSFYPRYFKGKYALHQRAYSLSDFEEDCNARYVYHYLNTKNNHFIKTCVGTTVRSLRMSSFESCEVELPSYPEQQKITDFLSAIDKQLEKVEQTVELLKEQKKGFMQQMFV